MVFPGVQEATWTRDSAAHEYYFHRFYDFQPDLNIDNPELRTEICRIIGYWLELGVAGFRVDAVPFVIESKLPNQKAKMRFDYLSEFRRFLQWRKGDAVLLGEANVKPPGHLKYFGTDDGEGIHMMFNFYANQFLFYALATGKGALLIKALEETRDLPEMGQWANFLRNHDELDLGRLSDEQRQTVFERFAPKKTMQLYDRGIRRRLAPMLGSKARLELAYSVMFSLPGTPVLRYGDEIGMGDDLDLPQREAVHTPMQWTDEPQAGFSLAAKTLHPLIDSGPYSYKTVNVEAQRRDPESLLNWTAQMIRLSKECPEIGWGKWEVLPTKNDCVLAMRYDWRGESIVVIHNFGEVPTEIQIRIKAPRSAVLIDLLDNAQSESVKDGLHVTSLGAYGYKWYRVGGLDQTLRRAKR